MRFFFDIILSSLALVILSPIMLVVALIILVETGRPIIHHSERLGQGGNPFKFWKFRTMYQNCPPVDYYKPDNDPRVTPIGKYLRKFSLDELPQLWNLVKGDMAIYGPRPWLVTERHLLGEYANDILSRRPGIINYYVAFGRSNLTIEQRLALDAKFARRMNFRQMVYATLRFFVRLIDRKGAK